MYFSIVISLFFIITNCWNGFANDAVWPILLAGYYVLIDVINGLLLRSFRKKPSKREERAIVRKTGYLMLGLDFLFLGMLSQMIISDVRESYNMVIIVANSIYTVYRVVVAIVNVARWRRIKNPTMMAVKRINLVAVLITATVLQASVVAFLGGDSDLIRAINGVVGVGVFVVILLLAGFLVREHSES